MSSAAYFFRRFTLPPRWPGRPAVERPEALTAASDAFSTACWRASSGMKKLGLFLRLLVRHGVALDE